MTVTKNSGHETYEVTRGAFVNLIGNLGKFSFLGFDLVATRMLGQEIYGYYSTTWMILNLAFIVCYFGAHRLVIDFVAKSKARGDSEFYRAIVGCVLLSLVLSSLLVAAVYVFAFDIAQIFNKPPLAQYLKIVCLSAPFYCVTTIMLTATRGLKIMRVWVFVRQGLEPLLDFVLILSIVLIFGVSTAPFLARALAFGLGCIASIWFFSKYFSLRGLFGALPDINQWRHIFVFGFPVMLADFLFTVILRLDIIPLSLLVPAAQVAVFQVVLNIGNVMRNIPMAIDPIMMPIVVEMRHRGDLNALNDIYSALIRIAFLLCFGFFMLVALSGDLILSMYGSDFVTGNLVLVLVIGGLALHTVFSSIEPVLVMSGYPYLNLMNSVFFVTINLIIDFLLIPAHGLTGAAIGCFSASVLTSIVQILQFHFLLKIHPLSWSMLKPLVFGVGLLVLAKISELLFLESTFYRILVSLVMVLCYFLMGWRFFFRTSERQLLGGLMKIKSSHRA
ncbi:MAG: oligosaccharide flippase family protein [Bacteroidetes bacterium]|nr:oligosaccharide flippase family protein [Bacteroidota bacterium]